MAGDRLARNDSFLTRRSTSTLSVRSRGASYFKMIFDNPAVADLGWGGGEGGLLGAFYNIFIAGN